MIQLDTRRAKLTLSSLLATFVVIRLLLHLSPDSDFNVGGHNIHHLFTGLLLITCCGIPLVVLRGNNRWLDGAAAGFGVGLALALDEWVYLIVTDGSNASYLLPVSLWGGVVMIGLACLVLLAVWKAVSRGGRSKDEP